MPFSIQSQSSARLFCSAALLAASAGTTLAGDINVPGDFFTITAAIASASDGDRILLAAQLYPENLIVVDKDLEFVGAGIGQTLLEGQGLGSVFNVSDGASVTLRNLTVQGGDAFDGGGLLATIGTSITIDSCEFRDNFADDDGAAITTVDADLTVTDSIFRNNTTRAIGGNGEGGAVQTVRGVISISDSTFEGNNSAGSGGAIQFADGVVTVQRCDFLNNASTARGGAIFALNAATGTITDTRFEGNSAGLDGGAIYHISTPMRYERCEFIGNACTDPGTGRGGAVFASGETSSEMQFINSLFRDNNAAVGGGAIAGFSGPDMRVYNCTVVNNTAGSTGGALFSSGGAAGFTLRNSIVWGNGASPIAASTNDAYNNVEGGLAGVGNIDAAPMFVDPGANDFRLMPGSPSIDSGDASLWANNPGLVVELLEANPTDLDGNARVANDPGTSDTGLNMIGQAIDMGAYELQPVVAAACVADINGDGIVDNGDIGAFVQLFLAGCP